MDYPIKRFLLTPSEAVEKALVVEQIKIKTGARWAKGKKTNLAKLKGRTLRSKKKN